MVRELACFSSTAIWVESAYGDVVVVAFVSTCAFSYLPFSACRDVGFARWTGPRHCFLCRRDVRFLRQCGSIFAFLSLAFAFSARTFVFPFNRADDIVSEGTLVAARAFSFLCHLSASNVLLVAFYHGRSSEAGLVRPERGLMLPVLNILKIKISPSASRLDKKV